jgi:DNA-binding MarR family transcriptional regulator
MEYDELKLEYQLCFPLYACSREIVKRYRPFLEPLGLTYTKYIALMVLWELGAVTVKELGKKLFLDSGTLTPLLKSMEAAGLVRRSRSGEDERSLNVTLTDTGRELKKAAAEVPAKMSRCLSIDPGDAAALYRILYSVLRNGDKEPNDGTERISE